MADSDISRVYADSLFEIANESGSVLQCEKELDFFCRLIRDDPQFRVLINNPGISVYKKKDFIKKVFSEYVSKDFITFLYVLLDNNRQGYIISIKEAYELLLDEKENRQRVTIITSNKIDESFKKNISQQLQKKLKKEILISEKQDPSILGGVIVKIDDLVIDGSLVKDLKHIKKSLLKKELRRELVYED